jgi:hypothetical protein
MSARKLGRFAGLVFVLAALIAGGVGAVELGTNHSSSVPATHQAIKLQQLDLIWD